MNRLCDAYGMAGLFMDGFPALTECYEIINKMLDSLLPNLSEHFKNKDILTPMVRYFIYYYYLFEKNLPLSSIAHNGFSRCL